MARTRITGKQITPKAINNEHLSEDLRISEGMLALNYPTHGHNNKSAIDAFECSNNNAIKKIDVVSLANALLDIINSRDTGKTLAETIKAKASDKTVQGILEELATFKGESPTLKAALDAVYDYTDLEILDHMGLISHLELDLIHADIINSRGGYSTLAERLSEMSLGNGGTGSLGSSEVWIAETIVSAGETRVTTPNQFDINSKSLMVYEGPLLLTKDVDYSVIDSTTINLNVPLEENTRFKFIGTEIGNVYEWSISTITKENQALIPTMFKYAPNMGQLEIYEDGLSLVSGVDYTEVDNFNIELNYQAPSGCYITINKRR